MGEGKSSKPKLSPAEQKKRSIRLFGILSIVFYLLCIGGPVAVLVFSFTSISSTTEAGNRTILNGANSKIPEPCSDDPGLKTHRPLRFAFGENEDPLSCAWDVLPSVLRLTLSFLSFGVIGVCFFFTFIHRSRKMFLFSLLIIAVAAGYGYLGYDDSKIIAASNKWCEKENMKGVQWTHAPVMIKCMYGPLILVPVFDFISAVLWLFLAVFVINFVCKAGPGEGKLKKGLLLPDDGEKKAPDDHFGPPEEDDVPEPQPEKKKRGGGGFFNFFGGGNKAQPIPDEEPEETGGEVNFERESKSRFAPMSKTDKEAAKDLPLGSSSSDSNQTVGNALFNFEDAGSSSTETSQNAPAQTQPAAQPKPQPQAQPKPQSSGAIDFEALAGGGDNPFA